jgi:hypothetical protein
MDLHPFDGVDTKRVCDCRSCSCLGRNHRVSHTGPRRVSNAPADTRRESSPRSPGSTETFTRSGYVAGSKALTDDEALAVLSEWNLRSEPPWTERELRDKIARARRYGKEEIGDYAAR